MAAEGVLISALQKIALVAAEKGLELYEVYDHIQPMRCNLETIQAVLKDADSIQQKTESVKVWLKHVKELAYKISDAMDKFLVEIEKNRTKSSGFLRKFKRVLKHPIKLNTLSGEFKAIEAEMERIFKAQTQLGNTGLGSGSEQPAKLLFRPSKPFHVVDVDIVGFEADKRKIINHLLNENISRRTVLSIVGVGGLGKTTFDLIVLSAAVNIQ